MHFGKSRIVKSFLIALLLLFAGAASAQPFGIIMGQQAEDLKGVGTARPFVYSITPLKTHSEMESYVVTATPGQGVCLVRGVGVDHDNDGYGSAVQRAVGELRRQVEATYGPGKLFDHLNAGSMWHESNYWIMGILKNERSYQVSWANNSVTNLPNNVAEILETVVATESEKSYVTLQFKFKNYTACKAEMTAVATKVF